MIHHVLEKAPYEVLKGRKLNLTHLRAFGYACYVYNGGKDSLGKFDAKIDERIFLGYSSQSKSYKVFNSRTNSVEQSVHVIFEQANHLSKKGMQVESKVMGLTIYSEYDLDESKGTKTCSKVIDQETS